uniref:Uncharacterized protein n=1 Tax=Arundo donax TaxID=35708 RepID=A0A0A9GZA6_ARUDO
MGVPKIPTPWPDLHHRALQRYMQVDRASFVLIIGPNSKRRRFDIN